MLGGSVACQSGKAPSLRQLQLPQKRLVARIADEPAHESVALDVRKTAVALVIGTLEPLEREIGLATEGMHFGDLIGRYVTFRDGYAALRRTTPRPRRPKPSSASVPGSGTLEITSVTPVPGVYEPRPVNGSGQRL